MIPLYRPEQVRAMDERTIAAGTPSLTLMERAAGHLARAIRTVGGRTYGLRVLVVCGKGNNGGDGIAAARRLRAAGADARVHLLAGDTDLSPDAAAQLRRYRAAGGREVASLAAWDRLDVVVDCLLGTGASGGLRDPYGAAVETINALGRGGASVVACDLPTGVDADTGQVEGKAVRADLTVSLGAHKRGLWLSPARQHCGELVVADIGIAPAGDVADDQDGPAAVVLSDADVREILPQTGPGADKRGRGVVLALAGSPGMSGAPTMVAHGALATGVGLLTVATSQRIRDIVAPTIPEALTLALPEDDPDAAFAAVAEQAQEVDVLAIGPGLGHDDATSTLVRRLLREVDVAIVLDADGLNVYRGDGDVLADRATAELVCTPHVREFARLLGKDAEDVWPDRVNTVAEAARRWRATVVAKGPGTIIQAPAGPTWINATGTAALATGGTGDVLTGMIASALAGGAGAEAVAAAVHVHGLAGQIAAARGTPRSVSAMDVAAAIPAALAAVEQR
jgi:ADP-dependent NAD(P)H-hydrate dehydratase / NAD(P)H-hydrate epimerase